MLSIINYVLHHHASTMNHITISHISLQVVDIGDDADKNYDDGDEDVTRPVLFIHWNRKIDHQRILETYDQFPVNFSGCSQTKF